MLFILHRVRYQFKLLANANVKKQHSKLSSPCNFCNNFDRRHCSSSQKPKNSKQAAPHMKQQHFHCYESHKISCSYILRIYTEHPVGYTARQKHIQRTTKSWHNIWLNKTLNPAHSQTHTLTQTCTQPSIFNTQTASRGTDGTAEARLEGM